MKKIMIATSISPKNIENQQAAIGSWCQAGFSVFSFNAVDEIKAVREFFPDIPCEEASRDASAEKGRPLVYVYDVLQALKRRSDEDGISICGIVNSDIHLRNIDGKSYRYLRDRAKNGLVYGHRYDIDAITDVTGTEYIGLDFFFFDRTLIDLYQDDGFVIGSAAWDYWMVFIARHFGKRAKLLRTPIAYHIRHPQTWDDATDYQLKKKLARKYLGESSARATARINDAVFGNPYTITCPVGISEKSVLVILPENAENAKTIASLNNQSHKNKRIVFADASNYDFNAAVEDYVLIAADGLLYHRHFLSRMICAAVDGGVTCQLELIAEKMDAHTLFVFNAKGLAQFERRIIIGCTLNSRAGLVSERAEKAVGGRHFIDESLVSIEYDDHAKGLINRLSGKRIYLFGAGRSAQYLINNIDLSSVRVLGIVDSNRRLHGQLVGGIPVVDRDVLKKEDTYDAVLITALRYEFEIYQMLAKTIPEEKIARQFHYDGGGTWAAGIFEKLRYQDLILIGDERYISMLRVLLRDVFILECILERSLSSADLRRLKKIPGNNALIVCASKNPDSLVEKLSDLGLTRDEHFIVGETLIDTFDYEIFGNRKIVYAGQSPDAFKAAFPLAEIAGIYNPETDSIEALPKDAFVVIADSCAEARDVLVDCNVPSILESRLFEAPRPSRMFFELLEATKKSDGLCISPFRTLRVSTGGTLDLCISAWSKVKLGNICESGGRELWNSYVAGIFRLSVLDGRYCFCDMSFCAEGEEYFYKNRERFQRHVKDGEVVTAVTENQAILPYGPKYLFLGYDATCNLKCPQCRRGFFRADAEEERLNGFATREIIARYLVSEPTVAAAHGEYFVSRHYKHVIEAMKKYKNPGWVAITTNGLLFTSENWEYFDKRHHYYFGFSIDAATPETYARVRGGDFDKVVRNLGFAGTLKEKGEIDRLDSVFVVSALNYMEMIPFIHLSREAGVERILFYRIGDWGSMDYFPLYDVANPAHPLHHELVEILRDDVFDAPDVVLCRNLADLRGRDVPRPGKTVLYGWTSNASRVLDLPFVNADYIVDNHTRLHGKTVGKYGLPIYSPDVLSKMEPRPAVIITERKGNGDIARELSRKGLLSVLDAFGPQVDAEERVAAMTEFQNLFFKEILLQAVGRRVAIWGASYAGREACHLLRTGGVEPEFFVDRNAVTLGRDEETGLPVFSPECLESGMFVLVASSNFEAEIAAELETMGFGPGDRFLYFGEAPVETGET